MLTLAFFLILIPIINTLVNMRKCPSDHDLNQVVFGRTNKNSNRTDTVIKHLGICKKCQDRVREMNEESNQAPVDKTLWEK